MWWIIPSQTYESVATEEHACHDSNVNQWIQIVLKLAIFLIIL